MADPAPVAQTFFVDEDVEKFSRLDGIVTLVDAKHIEARLDEEKPEGVENEAVEQVAFADRMILNKIDLVSEEDLVRVEARLRSVNAFAPIFRTERSTISVDDVLNIHGFDLKRTLEMDPEFLNTDGDHQHDSSVSSVSITTAGELDLDEVQEFVGYILGQRGNDIYRMKGVLNIAGCDNRYVYQAVHMIYNSSFDQPWGADEDRENKLVFIGKNLDKTELNDKFKQCILTPEKIEEKKQKFNKAVQSLRFRVGDKVECNTGNWSKGEVVALLYREQGIRSDLGEGVAPYQIKLDNGTLIFAPMDDDRVIRKAA